MLKKILNNKWLKINKYDETNEKVGILDKEQGMIIKAICCIIVILVHIPKQHGNALQDAISSFGYVAVSIFFMLSAYGLRYSVENKPDYIKHFWRNRILVLLIPFWLTRTISAFLQPQETILETILTIIGVQNIIFITILLCYYIIFWCVYKFIKNSKIRDYLLCGIVLLYSFMGKACQWPTGWLVESMGLFYGILMYHLETKIKNLKTLKQGIFFGIISAIIGLLYLKYKEVYLLGTWGLKTILSISLILLLTTILNQIHIESTCLSYLGSITYEIYLMHAIVIHVLRPLEIPSTLWILLVIFICILLGMGIHYIDKKIIKRIKKTYKESFI